MKHTFSESDIWALIEEKDFAQLSEQEKKEVLQFMTEKDYLHQRELHLSISESLSVLPPELKMKPAVAAQIFEQGKKKRNSLIKRFARYQIPAWQAAAAAFFMAFAFYTWGATSSVNQTQSTPSGFTHDSLAGISLEEDTSLNSFLIEI